MKEIIVNGDRFVPFLTEEKIQERIKELAAQIKNDYKNLTPVFIGVLNGSFIFLADFVKNYDGDCEIDFLKLSSYGESKISSGNVTILKELNVKVENRDLIIVEDIVDTGLSIKFIKELIEPKNPASVKILSLLMKPDSLKYDIKIDYIGFNIPSKFVLGYGLDYAQKFRNLKSIYVLEDNSN